MASAPSAPAAALEGGHDTQPELGESGRPAAHSRRRPARGLESAGRTQHRGPAAHEHRAQWTTRRHESDSKRLDRLPERRARARAAGSPGVRRRDPLDGQLGPAGRAEHAAVLGRRRDLGPAAGERGPRRRSGLRQSGGGHHVAERHGAAGVGGHARDMGPLRYLSVHAEPRLPGAPRQLRLLPEPRDQQSRTHRPRVVLERPRPPRRPGPGRVGRRLADRLGRDDAEHGRHADRHARSHAARGATSGWPLRGLPHRLPQDESRARLARGKRRSAGGRPAWWRQPSGRARSSGGRSALGCVGRHPRGRCARVRAAARTRTQLASAPW